MARRVGSLDTILPKNIFPVKRHKLRRMTLSSEQQIMYRSETMVNFRTLYRLLGTRSSYILHAHDIAPPCVIAFLEEIGQYAELAFGPLSPSFLWNNLSQLSQPGYPLDSSIYPALTDGVLFESFYGAVANLHASIVYRQSKQQLILAFSGTSSLSQALRDIYATRHKYKTPDRRKGLRVHFGFWTMYKGIRDHARESLRKAFAKYEHQVSELVVTGHSLGGSMAYLFCLDLLQRKDDPIMTNNETKIILTAFGSPRLGNEALVKYWVELTTEYRQSHGPLSLQELFVKTYKDGVPCLPTTQMGYRHFPSTTFYFIDNLLYTIPCSEIEHSVFQVDDVTNSPKDRPTSARFPRGGHNYYGRDIERLARQMAWIDTISSSSSSEGDWEKEYIRKRDKWEKKWQEKYS